MVTDNQWAFDLGTTIFSIVKSKTLAELKSKYPGIFVTDKGKTNGKAVFPTVYIQELSGSERGADLEGKSINAVLETIQVDVTTNTSRADVNRVMYTVASIFKQMAFTVQSMPDFEYNGETYRKTARFQRIIGANDRLI